MSAIGHLADMLIAARNVRFRGTSGHRGSKASCLLLTQSGHHAHVVTQIEN